MPVDPASLDPYAQQAANDHPDLLGNVEWLRKACRDPDPNAGDELLRVLLALVEDALHGALPLLGQTEWLKIAGCLQEIKDCYPEAHEGLLTRFERHGLTDPNAPFLPKANANLNPAAKPLADAMRTSRKTLKNSERSVAEAAEQSIESITTTRHRVDTEAEDIKEGMDEALSLVREQGDEAKAEMESLLEELKERYGFTTGAVLGGSHETSAESETILMRQHERTARRASVSAVVLATVIVVLRLFGVGPSGIEGHLATVPFLGPVAVLLYIASVETRVASVHRHNAARWLGLSLQLKSLGPFIDDIAHKAQTTQTTDDQEPPAWKDTLVGEVLKEIFQGDIGPYTPPTRRSVAVTDPTPDAHQRGCVIPRRIATRSCSTRPQVLPNGSKRNGFAMLGGISADLSGALAPIPLCRTGIRVGGGAL